MEEAKFELRSHHVVAHRKDSPSEKAHNVMYSSTQFTRSSTLAQIWLFSHFQQPTATPQPHKDLEYYHFVAANKGHSVCLELLLGAHSSAKQATSATPARLCAPACSWRPGCSYRGTGAAVNGDLHVVREAVAQSARGAWTTRFFFSTTVLFVMSTNFNCFYE